MSAVALDLDYDETAQAVADAVAAYTRDRCSPEAVRGTTGRFPSTLWHGLAELGVLAVATPEGEGGPLELAAAMEALGRAAFPGPLVETVLAARVLPEAPRAAVVAGDAVVSVGSEGLWPWAFEAAVFVEIAGGRLFSAEPPRELAREETLGGDVWGRGAAARGDELPGAAGAFALSDVARAAYLAAAGRRLVDDAAEHARTRRQFGRPIGDFQAVAHPLADAAMGTLGAAALARAAAWRLAEARDDGAAFAAAARLSATRAALAAAATAHQVFGAQGATADGPVFFVSRRIRQVASLPPGPEPARAAARELVLGRGALA